MEKERGEKKERRNHIYPTIIIACVRLKRLVTFIGHVPLPLDSNFQDAWTWFTKASLSVLSYHFQGLFSNATEIYDPLIEGSAASMG